MKLRNLSLSLLFSLIFIGCEQKREFEEVVEWVSTTNSAQWIENPELLLKKSNAQTPDVEIYPTEYLQNIDGFGACFNELGWTSLALLSEEDRNEIMAELFSPGKGLNFNVSRMPVGANDFSLNWYSYDEVKDDFSLDHFSIENDEKTLIPFIKKAKQYNPDLKIWASPWSPPTWMKYNNHYACRPDENINDLLGDPTTDLEGTNMFIQEDKYMEAYAKYFGKFVDAYADNGISIYSVAPQNEFNSCQNFPSCTWTAASLAKFIGQFLGPEMAPRNVAVMLGTMERPNVLLLDTILNDSFCKKYITSIGFQWAGKDAIPAVHEKYPQFKLYQTEQECGDGRNDWQGAVYSWNLMKHYFSNGCNIYNYWNISLEKGGISRWGWAQNSLVVVDPETKEYEFSYEFYVMKHYSHYILPNAKRVKTSENKDVLAFKNADGSLVIIAGNFTNEDKTVKIKVGNQLIEPQVKANSFNTFKISVQSNL